MSGDFGDHIDPDGVYIVVVGDRIASHQGILSQAREHAESEVTLGNHDRVWVFEAVGFMERGRDKVEWTWTASEV